MAKKRKNSRAKGNGYELKLAKLLSAWDPSFNYRRTPLSGGWDKQHAPGDVMVPDWFPWIFEAKNREGWHLEQLLKSPDKNPVMSWWQEESEKQGDKDNILLVFTKNFDSNYFMLPTEEWSKLTTNFGNYSGSLFYLYKTEWMNDDFVIGLFDQLLDWLDPESMTHYFGENGE